jgi:hypothetical protein
VVLVGGCISKEIIASIIRDERISELRTLALTSNCNTLRSYVLLCSVLHFLVAADVVPRSLILSTLMIEVIYFSETSVLTRGTPHHIPEDGNIIIKLCWGHNSYPPVEISLYISANVCFQGALTPILENTKRFSPQ